MKNFLSEFKQFISRGNVVDLAIGVVIGGAFGKIVTSLVSDIIMPVVGMLVGKVDFTTIMLGQVSIGNFIQNVIDFLIVAFVIFLVIKGINRFKKKEEKKAPDEAPAIPNEEKLLMEIRDLLKNK